MTEHLEIEYKNLLTKDEFILLKNYVNVAEQDFFCQTNEYFDTANFDLKKAGCALRIREKYGQLELTLKQPKEVGLLETNEFISERQRRLIIEQLEFPEGLIRKKLDAMQIPVHKIKHFGVLTTYRAEVSYLGGLLALDKSYYLNHEDFEVEYEVSDPKSRVYFNQLLDTLHIPIRQTKNKVERFFQELHK